TDQGIEGKQREARNDRRAETQRHEDLGATRAIGPQSRLSACALCASDGSGSLSRRATHLAIATSAATPSTAATAPSTTGPSLNGNAPGAAGVLSDSTYATNASWSA